MTDQEQVPTLGLLLQMRRRELGHSQNQAALIMGITQTLTSRLERGLADPFPRLTEIAGYLGQKVEAVRRVVESEMLDGDMEQRLRAMAASHDALQSQVASLDETIASLGDRLNDRGDDDRCTCGGARHE